MLDEGREVVGRAIYCDNCFYQSSVRKVGSTSSSTPGALKAFVVTGRGGSCL